MATKILMKKKTSSGYDELYPITDASYLTNLKVLNTNNTTTNTTNAAETLYGTNAINLHRVAKTGANASLINYVGLKYGVSSQFTQEDNKGEIFNDYINNKAYGKYSSAFGSNTVSYGQSSFSCGLGTVATITLSAIPTAVTTVTVSSGITEIGRVLANTDLTQFVVITAISGSTLTLSSSFTSSSTTVYLFGGIAYNQGDFVAGYDCRATGGYSFSHGISTYAGAVYSHAEGHYTEAVGQISHSEGSATIARGNYSHAEGMATYTSGNGSHAEGDSTIAIGSYSHAEGDSTNATGSYSHAEGCHSTATEKYSHSEGIYTNAAKAGQHVFGIGNISDTGSTTLGNYTLGKFAEIVGGGSVTSAGAITAKNIRTLDWIGNLWLYNDVRCGGTSGDVYTHSLSKKIEHSFEKLTFVTTIPTSGMTIGYIYSTGSITAPGTPYIAISDTITTATTYSQFAIYEDQSNGDLYEYNGTAFIPFESGYKGGSSSTYTSSTVAISASLTGKSKIIKSSFTNSPTTCTYTIQSLQNNVEYILLFRVANPENDSLVLTLAFPTGYSVFASNQSAGIYTYYASGSANVSITTKIAISARILRIDNDVFVNIIR